MGDSSTNSFKLRNLPLAARLVLAVFLVSVGLGYLSAIVQVHFQHADPGELMPGTINSRRTFHNRNEGKPPPSAEEKADTRPKGQIEQLVVADRHEKFDGKIQMSGAFFGAGEPSAYERVIKKRATALGVSEDKAMALVESEREGERLAMIEWLKAGGQKETFQKFPLPADWKKAQPVSKEMLVDDGKAVNIKKLFDTRCVRCHGEGNEQEDKPLETYEQIKTKYIPDPPKAAGLAAGSSGEAPREPGMSMTKLAQTTHVHLLGFAMLYGLTGLLFAFTGYPLIVRLVVSPLPLVMQVAEIGFWWLARLDKPHGALFADLIPLTAGLVGAGVFLHIVLGLFSLFGNFGKMVLLLLMLGAAAGGYVYVKPIVENRLQEEKSKSGAAEKKEVRLMTPRTTS